MAWQVERGDETLHGWMADVNHGYDRSKASGRSSRKLSVAKSESILLHSPKRGLVSLFLPLPDSLFIVFIDDQRQFFQLRAWL